MARTAVAVLVLLAAGAQAFRAPNATAPSSLKVKLMAEVASTPALVKQIADLAIAREKLLAAGDFAKVIASFAPNGVLISDFNELLDTPAKIQAYYDEWGKVRIQPPVMLERNIRFVNAETAIDTGFFARNSDRTVLPLGPDAAANIVARNGSFGTNGTQSIRRFTNVYQKQADSKWKRAVSHVSLAPKPEAAIPALRKMNVTSKAAIPAPSKETVKSKAAMVKQIREAFTNWADTVKKGDPKAVEALYTPDAILLPITDNILFPNAASSGSPLEKARKIVIEQDHVLPLGPDAAAYIGRYTDAMADGTKVPTRFSIVFVKRDGKWVIADQHVSKGPVKSG